ncbi:hypothetical protein GCM10029964_067130 [Kibdelosporangium lantanae]
MLLVAERQDGEVEQGVPLGRLRPVEYPGDLVVPVHEHVADLQVPVREHRCPRSERQFGDPTVVGDHIGGKDVVREEPRTLTVEPRRDLVDTRSTPRRQWCVVQRPNGGPAAAHASGDAVDGSPS